MFISANNNNFEFFFTKNIVPQEIEDKYMPYFSRIPGGAIERCVDFLNYGVQSINVNGAQYDIVEQRDRKTPYGRIYRSGMTPESTMGKDITITSQIYDGFVNYFLWLDLYYYYYNSGEHQHLPGVPFLRVFDGSGYETLSVEFKNLLFVSMDGLDLNFSSNTVDMKTFTCSFRAEEVEIKLAL